MDISKLVGETTDYDKKERLEERKPKSWLKSVSAFANGTGGTLFFGVSDHDELVGLEDAKKDAEKISEIIHAKMDPVPAVHLSILSRQDKRFIALRVCPGRETPYYYAADGNLTAYIRVGNESVPADALHLRNLVLKGSHLTYDGMDSPFAFKDFSFIQLRNIYKENTGEELSDSDFLSFGLEVSDGRLTYAGALLADQPLIRQSRLFCTRWNGLDKASGVIEALDDKEYSGSLVFLLQSGLDFVRNNTKNRWQKTEAGRVEMPDYPPRAVHEALVNALIHRDYGELGSEVHIDIFDDRLEIYSPGGMPDGSLVQDLDIDHVASRRRNPVIADVFGRMRLMERRGSGFKKIRSEYRKGSGYTPDLNPEFYSTNATFMVSLPNLNYRSGKKSRDEVALNEEKVALGSKKIALNDEKVALDRVAVVLKKTALHSRDEKRVLALAKTFGEQVEFGRSDVMSLCQLAPSTAGKFLRILKQEKLLKSGIRRGKYRFTFEKYLP